MIKVKYPETKSENGIRPGKYPPFETVATVVAIENHQIEYLYDPEEHSHNVDYTKTHRTCITFAFTDDDGKKSYSKETFYLGDVFPKEIGAKALGVAYMTQWSGRWSFRMTHILKG